MMRRLCRITALLTLIVAMGASRAYGQNSFYAEEQDLEPGTQATINLMLDNSLECYGFQAKVALPIGVTFESMTLVDDRTSAGNYQLITNNVAGTIYFGAFSASNPQRPITGSKGAVARMVVNVSETDYKGGKVTINDIKLVNKDDRDVSVDPHPSLMGVLPVKIELEPDIVEFKKGEEENLTLTFFPSYTTNKTHTWATSDPSVVSFDDQGHLTALELGNTTITVTTINGKKATCEVSVVLTPVESIEVEPKETTIKLGRQTTLSATVLPDNATNKTVTWTSSDESIATVDSEGTVTGTGLGTVTITATAGAKRATCLVTVESTPAESIIVNPESIELEVGEDFTLTAKIIPEDATYNTIFWTSADESIATVDSDGKVTALSVGTTVITATNGEEGISANCTVKINPISAKSIELIPESATLKIGEKTTLTVKVLPEDAADKTVTWTSGDPAIATVDENGNVTAIALGETTITATVGTLSATCKITVIPTPVATITVSPETATLKIGEKTTLTAKVLPEDASDKTVTWASGEPTIATVDEEGNVTAVALGETTITATVGTLSATCKIIVIATPVESIKLEPEETTLQVGEITSLSASISPEDATDKTITWASSNSDIAIVDEEGNVTAIALGEATITATAGDKSSSCRVTVIPTPAEALSLTNTELLMRVGHTSELMAIVRPENATDKSVVWTSSDESIATVDQNGVITALKVGLTTVIATTANGITAICEVTVVEEDEIVAVTEISVTPKEITLIEGDEYTLTAELKPEDADDKSVTWKSSDKAIAIVNENGVVTAVAQGTAVIYVSSSNGLTVECAVTVLPRIIDPTGISITNSELLMRVGYTSDLLAIVRPDDATDKSVVWNSEDESIVTVDQNGTVTAMKVGVTTVTATTVNGHIARCEVTVVEEHEIVAVTDISVTPTEVTLTEGDNFNLFVTVTPEDADDKSVTWRSSDRAIVTVSEIGELTAVSAGTATVYVSSSNGLTVECAVTVLPRIINPTSISITNTELLMRVGYTSELMPIVRPDDATDKRVTWSSSDESIATVDQNGLVTAIAEGVAIITITSVADPSVTGTCEVTVTDESRIIAVENLTLSDYTLEMIEGDTYTLVATVEPENAIDKSVTWRSSDWAIVTVSENGEVTAVSPGNAIVSASSSNGLTVECAITVYPLPVDPTGISITNTELLMRVGYTSDLIAIVRPDNADDKTVIWKSSDESIATVDQNGVVTALKVGVTTVTATTVNGLVARCEVTVVEEHEVVAVAEITVSPAKVTLTEGEKYTLTATVTPDDADDKTVTWRSSDRTIVTVDENGEVTAVSPGTATVYASSSNGLTAECAITVLPRHVDPTGISLTNTELLMRVGHTSDLLAIVRPDNASDKSVVWKSSDESIATVDQNGVVTAHKIGFTTVTATTVNGLVATCAVTVVDEGDIIAVADIKVEPTEVTLYEGETYKLVATVTPASATDKSVTWKSSDRAVATVAEDGTVTAVAEGTAIIYVSSSNGLTVECAVTVLKRTIEVSGLTLQPSHIDLWEGESATITAIITPADATDQTVNWTSENSLIAKVTYGNVVALTPGTTIITAETANGQSAQCTVVVHQRPFTPKQLLRKGDGTTSTFVVLMPLDNEQLAAKGYRYAFGYTDTDGTKRVFSETHLRYTPTTPEIFNNPSYDFWVYAFYTNSEGYIVNSNLRHLDGSEELCFDTSNIIGAPGRSAISDVATDDEWLTQTPTSLRIAPATPGTYTVAIYTITGIRVYAKTCRGGDGIADEIELGRFTPGAYVVTLTDGATVKSQRFVVR